VTISSFFVTFRRIQIIEIMTELHRESPLFDKVLVMQLQSGIQEARVIPLTVRIIPGTRSTNLAGQAERLVHIEITDENDPYFLYILDVGEQDFHQLKRDQSLLVEFPVFPTKLIDLIELCLASAGDVGVAVSSTDTAATASNSTFSAKLDMTSGAFSIIESNKFKQLNHISLQMRPGNDAAIKAYLSSRLAHTSAIASRKSEDLDKALSELEALRVANREITTELSELR
jgi:spindle assembly abnormal protein 6